MDKKNLEAGMAKIMDDIPEIEGMVALDGKGKLITGQTILKMDLNAIAKAVFDSYTKSSSLGSAIGKGGVHSILLMLENGSSCVVGNKDLILASLQGPDASSSVSLILRFMKGLI
ncbi:MAG: hypothetical protein ACTSUE_22695 [Promethearchaeota archaeon]